jgi:hypothetical protein
MVKIEDAVPSVAQRLRSRFLLRATKHRKPFTLGEMPNRMVGKGKKMDNEIMIYEDYINKYITVYKAHGISLPDVAEIDKTIALGYCDESRKCK